MAHALHHDVVGAFPGVLLGEHHHPAALGGHHGVVPFIVGVGPLGPESRQRGIHQLGMVSPKAVVVDAQPLADAGPETFDHNVGKAGQLQGFIPALRRLQV